MTNANPLAPPPDHTAISTGGRFLEQNDKASARAIAATSQFSFAVRHLFWGGWLAALLCLLPPLARAETAVQAWVQRYNGSGNDMDEAQAMAVDGSNNVIVTGSSSGSGSGFDYVTIKYSNAGVPLWTNRYNGPANATDVAYAVAVDASNNVLVTGFCSVSTVPLNSYDYATIKYSSAGVPLWTNLYDGPGNGDDQARAMAVDGSNDVIVTGASSASAFPFYSYDYATIKYSSAGMPVWTNRYHGGWGNDSAAAVVVDGSNDVIVTGSSQSGGGYADYATFKYSSAGVPLWTNRYNGPGHGDDIAKAVAVDGANNVIVTGHSYTSTNYTNSDYLTIKYSSAGIPLWTNRYNGPVSGNDLARAVAVDASDNVIVTGESYNGTNRDYATIQYSSAGTPLWTNRYDEPGGSDDVVYAMAVDGNGNVIVTGFSERIGHYADYATIKYSSAGVAGWTNRYNGPGNINDFAYAVALDGSGNVFVTGYSWGDGSTHDYATIKYSIVPAIALAIQQCGNQLVLRWTNAAFGLQGAPASTATFTNLPGATSPFTNPITSPQQYFRLIFIEGGALPP